MTGRGVRRLIPLDGAVGEGGGQILRSALCLSAATGQGFEITKIRARRSRTGLRPQHLAAARAAAMACGARLSGAFEGSPDLRFEPGPPLAGRFRFDIETAGSATLVLQTVVPLLALAGDASHVEVGGGTHVPQSPSADFLVRHWQAAVAQIGLSVDVELRRAGFYPKGGGELSGRIQGWQRPIAPLALEVRGALLGTAIVSGAAKLRGSVAERQAEAARVRLWEERRLEPALEIVRPDAGGPGSYLLAAAWFESGRAAFGVLGERGVRAERIGDRAARRLLKFLDSAGAVDAQLADQLAVPLALSGAGGRVSTSEVTAHLETVAGVLRAFGVPAETWGRRGGPGGLAVGRG